MADCTKELRVALRKDKKYRETWQANIAMAYHDAHNSFVVKTGKRNPNAQERHQIANNAANDFLKLLCNETEHTKGR